jgi:hypothetical protein
VTRTLLLANGALALALAAACNTNSDNRKPATASAPAPAPVAAAPAPAPHPDKCEVEMVGQLVLPPNVPPTAKLAVYVVDGDCAAADARPLARWEATPRGVFTGEVFTRWGADLTVCGAVEDAPGAPTTLWGKADGLFHAEKTGEVVFTDFKVPLSTRPKYAFPQPAPHAGER